MAHTNKAVNWFADRAGRQIGGHRSAPAHPEKFSLAKAEQNKNNVFDHPMRYNLPKREIMPSRLHILADITSILHAHGIDEEKSAMIAEQIMGRLVPESALPAPSAARPIPTQAPALWAESKQTGDTPPGFIKRHYGPWLGQGLTRADVRRLDFSLYKALDNWLRNPKNQLPDDCPLPTTREQTTEWLTRFQQAQQEGGTIEVPADPNVFERFRRRLERERRSAPKERG